jgi:hypothetical protein
MNKKNKQRNKKRWKNKKEETNGPSFLNQKTVLTLWYVKWSFFAGPHPQRAGS